jgi:hypothetical protein
MTLPDLALQLVYGKLAWAAVLAATVFSLLPAALQRSWRVAAGLAGAAAMLMLLPRQLSPAYWLALAFQWPSGLLFAACLLKLAQPWRPQAGGDSMPAGVAAVIVVLGAVLYLDGLGLISLGLYYWGFGAQAAPLLALGVGAVCVAGIVRGNAVAQHAAVLAAVSLFSVLRLPTGNPWDALLDPLLWAWALLALGLKGWRRLLRKRRATPVEAELDAAPALIPGTGLAAK